MTPLELTQIEARGDEQLTKLVGAYRVQVERIEQLKWIARCVSRIGGFAQEVLLGQPPSEPSSPSGKFVRIAVPEDPPRPP